MALNLRGASGPNRIPRAYTSGNTADLNYVLEHLKKSKPNQQLQVVGFSLGANLLLKWLGENSSQQIVDKAVAVSVPFELSTVATGLDQDVSKIYQRTLLKNTKKSISEKESIVQYITPKIFISLTVQLQCH